MATLALDFLDQDSFAAQTDASAAIKELDQFPTDFAFPLVQSPQTFFRDAFDAPNAPTNRTCPRNNYFGFHI